MGVLSLTTNWPARVPAAVGANTTLTVQVDPTDRIGPTQVFTWIEKSPLTVTLEMSKPAVPLLLRTTSRGGLLEPIFHAPNVTVPVLGTTKGVFGSTLE